MTREKISKDVRLSKTGSAKVRSPITSTDTIVKKNTKKKNKERIIKNPSLQPRKIVEAKPSTSLSSPGKVGYFEEIPNWKIGVIKISKKKWVPLRFSGIDARHELWRF